MDGDGIEDAYDEDDDGDGFSDEDEIAYPSDPRDPNSVANTAPTNLRIIGDLSIHENQPIGTIVGHFSADDADGDELSFVMYNGGQALNNDYFTIDANGTLRTNGPGYELDGAFSLSVEVKAMDEHGGEVSGSFDITYNDVNEPPSGSVTISGTPIVGQQLTASDNLSDNDQGGIGSKTYRWYRYGDDYEFEQIGQNTKYTIGSGVIGEQLVVVVTFGSGDFAETVLSNPTEPVNGPPANLQSTAPITVVENGNRGWSDRSLRPIQTVTPLPTRWLRDRVARTITFSNWNQMGRSV